MGSIYKDNWKSYREMGLTPLPAKGKTPAVKWDKEDLVDLVSDDFANWEENYPDSNIWVLLGDELAVIDPDGLGAEEFVQSLSIPDGPVSISGGKSRHRWFKTTHPIKPLKVKMNDGSFLEVRTSRQGMLVPPSIHPDTQKAYKWLPSKAIWDLPLPVLPPEAYKKIESLKNHSGNGSGGNGKAADKSLPGWEDVYMRGVTEGDRNNALTKLVGKKISEGMKQEDLLIWAHEWNLQNDPPMEKREVEQIVASVFRTHQRNHPGEIESVLDEDASLQIADGNIDVSSNPTDMGNSARFLKSYGLDVRFCKLWNRWLVWDGQRWEIDQSGKVEAWAQKTVLKIYDELSSITNKDKRRRMTQHAERSQTPERVRGLLTLSEPHVSIKPDDLDKDPMILNVLNGAVDLNTGNLMPHNKHHYITKLAPVDYIQGADCPNWKKHLNKIFVGNRNLISFLQIAFGYSLTGVTDADVLFIMWGTGANGKTVTHETMARVLGDYAIRTPTETLLIKPGGGIPNDVARLKGARFVFASEAEEGKKLAQALVKDLTGGDTVSARFMRAEYFQFKPACKIWLSTNHKPNITGTDYGIWRRIRLIPFTVTIPESERLPRREFDRMMWNEASGILNWGIEGCQKLIANRFKLHTPEEVQRATQAYRDEMDVIGGFIEERCAISPDAIVAASDLYNAYSTWCADTGEKAMSQKAFALRLLERGITKNRTSGSRRYCGIALLDTSREVEASVPVVDDLIPP